MKNSEEIFTFNELNDVMKTVDELSLAILNFNVSYETLKSHTIYYIGNKLPTIV